MEYTTVQTPRGTKDFLPRDAQRKRWVEETLLKLFEQWNYREIVTPTIEFSDAVSAGGATGLGDNLYRFFEREGGLIALRPDATTPVARVVATRLREEPKPIRLCYSANVFRYAEPQTGRRREFYQAGVELVGSNGYLADAEIVALAVQSLQAVGLKDFRIDIGHVDYYDGILQHGVLSSSEKRGIRTALLRKDYVALGKLLASSNLSRADRELLGMLPDLRGGKDVLREALDRATNPVSERAIGDLSAIYDALEAYDLAHWVQVDLGMVKDIEYYTGVVLEAYTADMGFTIGTGGRYDKLIGHFGYDCPATGFALGVERIMLALSKQGGWPGCEGTRVLCARASQGSRLGWQIAQKLRQQGHRVELDVVRRNQSEILEYAEAMDFQWVALPFTPDEIQVWNMDMGWRTMDLPTLLTFLEGGENRG
ncbi:MAG: ATP phosphoribosyltransferase regulatory subunit [Firmicutes bacterium]|nr:ATP phosphoribosyltransferase regulatory subunit [Bacillota bacterium]